MVAQGTSGVTPEADTVDPFDVTLGPSAFARGLPGQSWQ